MSGFSKFINPQEPVKLFQISNVTGFGLDTFRESLYSLQNRVNWEKNREHRSYPWVFLTTLKFGNIVKIVP